MGYIAGRRQSVHPPAAGPRVTRPDLPLSHRGAPLGVDPGPGGPPEYSPGRDELAHRQLANAPACSLPDDRPRKRSARYGPPRTGEFPRPPLPAPLLSFVRSRARPQSSHLPRPTGPPSHPLDPLDPPSRPPPLAVGAGSRPPITHAHACLLWPSLRRPRSARGLRGWGGRLQRFPSSSVAVELRPSAARPRDAPTRRPAHRLSHGLSGPRRPPLVRATAPVSGDDSQGEGFRTTCGPPGLEHPSQLANWQAHCLPSV